MDHGHQIARGQRDDHRRQPQDRPGKAVEHHDDADHQAGQRQIGQGAEIIGAVAAGDIGHRHLDQRKAHQADDGAGDHRGDHPAQLVDALTEGDLDERGAETHAEQRGQDLLRRAAPRLDDEAGAEDGAEKAEAGALQAQQSGADGAEAPGLGEGAETGDEQRHADEVGDVLIEAKRAADDQGGGDDTDEAGQHVLQGGEGRG